MKISISNSSLGSAVGRAIMKHAGVMDTADTVIMLRTEVSRPVGNEPQPYILI